ncbi:MAG: type II secretion system GspH family protein [bacterium]|nr:type II secretion system GspH family protein [bacterium]MCM1374375.1 type II secretion system GspH family protein [Muribaculum sp.]
MTVDFIGDRRDIIAERVARLLGKDIMKKWWRELWRRGNKGLTLVELICSIAIFSVATVMVGSAMVVSANSYNRGATEIDLQQDAQIAANILTNIVIDSDEIVSPSGAAETNVLTVKKGGVEYHVDLIGSELIYSQSDETETAVLAENVAEFRLSLLPDGENVQVLLGLARGDREFSSSYTITPRNATPVGGSSISASYIDIANKIVLEPLESYDFSGAVVHGCSNQSLVWGAVTGNSDPNTRLINGVLTIGASETASEIHFTVRTAQLSESGSPMAEADVTVYVRRVNHVTLTASLVNGTAYSAGAQYKITASVAGNNLRDINAINGEYTYVMDDRCESVAFRNALCDLGGVANVVPGSRHEDTKGSSILIELFQDMPAGGKIVIGGESRHAAGEKNKAQPASYAYIYDLVTIEKPSSGIIHTDQGIGRAYAAIFTSSVDVTTLRDNNRTHPDNGLQDYSAQPRWFYRIREKGGSGEWSSFKQMTEEGSTKKLNEWESQRFLPDRSYEMEIIIAVVNQDSKILYWPKDESIMSGGTGFETFRKGWTDGTTPKSDYSSVFDVPKVQMTFSGNAAYGVLDGSVSFGSYSHPISLNSNGDSLVVELTDTNFTAFKLGTYQNDIITYIEKWNGSSWVPSSANGWDVQQGRIITITNRMQPHNDSSQRGLYRLGVCIKREATFYEMNTNDVFDQSYHTASYPAEDYRLCDPTTGAGYIYVYFP